MSDKNDEYVVKRKKKIIEDLDELEDIPVVLPSQIKESNKQKKEKKKKEEIDRQEDDASEWLATISSFKIPKVKAKGKDILSSLYDTGEGKKKKKKKKKTGELTDYNKEFEPELALINNILREQKQFTDSLQSKFDSMESTKASTRGIGKFTIDLANSISQARSLSMQLVDKRVGLKKSIADLTFKEKKEFGAANGDGSNLDAYAANYLKQLVDKRGFIMGDMNMSDLVSDGDEDALFSELTESLGLDDRDSDVEKYLKYENDKVNIYVLMSRTDENDYDFVAETKHGEILTDYPLPEKSRLTVNTSTMKATDVYGSKYDVVYKD